MKSIHKRLRWLIITIIVIASTAISVYAIDYTGTGEVVITINPEYSTYQSNETQAVLIKYNISIKPPEDSYIGAFQFTLMPSAGMSLAKVEDAETGYFINPENLFNDDNLKGIYLSINYGADTNILLAGGTIPPVNAQPTRVQYDEIDVMTIVASVPAGSEGEFKIDVEKIAEQLIVSMDSGSVYDLSDINIVSNPATVSADAGYNITGAVSSTDNSRDIELTLLHASSDIAVATETLTAGTKIFTFTAVQNGTYDILVEKVGALPLLIKDVVVSGANIDFTLDGSGYESFKMIEGNINGDSKVSFDDLTVIRNQNNYNKLTSDAGVNPNADINGDGRVDFNDLSVVRNQLNYNKTTTDSVITIVE